MGLCQIGVLKSVVELPVLTSAFLCLQRKKTDLQWTQWAE